MGREFTKLNTQKGRLVSAIQKESCLSISLCVFVRHSSVSLGILVETYLLIPKKYFTRRNVQPACIFTHSRQFVHVHVHTVEDEIAVKFKKVHPFVYVPRIDKCNTLVYMHRITYSFRCFYLHHLISLPTSSFLLISTVHNSALVGQILVA